MDDPLIGRTLRDYEVVEQIGGGGMGVVYRVRHRRVGVERALKLLRAESLGTKGVHARFEREARLLATVEHPNVVRFHEFGAFEDGTPFLVMELLRGESLKQRLGSRGKLQFRDVLRIFSEVCDGLEVLHEVGVIHRDLSPDNVFLASSSKGEQVKLIDLGIALPVDAESLEHLTQTGMFVGKYVYVSPDQIGALGEGETLDGRSDLYSLGVMIYEAVAGARPFESGTPAKLLARKLHGQPESLAERALDLPVELVTLVDSLLARDRDGRPRTAADVREALLALGAERTQTVSPLGSTTGPLPAPGQPQVGSDVGEYRLEAVIGEGGMGVVYRARHRLLGVERAVKLIRRELTLEPQARERFLREARILAQLEHPSLVRLHECGELSSGQYFLAQELVVGESLGVRIAREGRLAHEKAVPLIVDAARGLRAAHDRGVIHRDVSPDNLMIVRDVDGNERLKVIDFGIARATLESDRSPLTLTGALVGKLEYMSPEQAGKLGEGEELDARADIYSLGVVLYHALVGKLPFDATTPMGYLAKHLMDPPVPPSGRGVQLPPALEKVMLRLLEKERGRRPHTMGEVARLLEGELARHSDPLSRPDLKASREWTRMVIAAVTCGSIVVGVTLLWTALGRVPPEPVVAPLATPKQNGTEWPKPLELVPPDNPMPTAITSRLPTVTPMQSLADLNAILVEAEVAVQRGQWTHPAGASAVDLYRSVLQRSPANEAAQAGLATVNARLMERGDELLGRGDVSGAAAAYRRAQSITDSESVRARLADIERRRGRERMNASAQAEWETLQRATSVEGIQAFLRAHPDSDYTKEAERQMMELRDDTAAFEDAKAKNTREALSAYLERIGKRAHDAKAQQLLAFRSLCPDGMVMIPGGSFMMGSAEGTGNRDERPQHPVTLSQFCMDVYEVTNLEYEQFDGEHRNQRDEFSRGDRQPASYVTWEEASTFCRSRGKRLPTEAEWEMACRGGLEATLFPWGNGVPDGGKANIHGRADGFQFSAPVGSFPPNAYGLYDMAGNAWEWVADLYDKRYYERSPAVDPLGPVNDASPVARGGSWDDDADDVRCAFRRRRGPTDRGGHGFRCAKSVP